MAQSQAHSHEAAHGQAHKMARTGVQGANEAGRVFGQRVHVVTGPGNFASPLTAKIEGDAAIAILESSHLIIEQARVAEQAVSEDDGFRSRAGVLVIDLGAIDGHCRHGAYFMKWNYCCLMYGGILRRESSCGRETQAGSCLSFRA